MNKLVLIALFILCNNENALGKKHLQTPNYHEQIQLLLGDLSENTHPRLLELSKTKNSLEAKKCTRVAEQELKKEKETGSDRLHDCVNPYVKNEAIISCFYEVFNDVFDRSQVVLRKYENCMKRA